MLVAMNECCKSEAEFMSEVQWFVAGRKKILAGQYGVWPEGQLLFEYFSYSSDSNLRWGGMDSARLSERHYRRILADPERRFKVRMVSLKQLPEKYFYQLLKYGLEEIKYLALNNKCPGDILEILAQDKDARSRMYIADNPSCPERILDILSKDKDELVRWYVAWNPSCTERLLERLAKDNISSVSATAQERLAKSLGIGV